MKSTRGRKKSFGRTRQSATFVCSHRAGPRDRWWANARPKNLAGFSLTSEVLLEGLKSVELSAGRPHLAGRTHRHYGAEPVRFKVNVNVTSVDQCKRLWNLNLLCVEMHTRKTRKQQGKKEGFIMHK